jgi:glutaryl-CoA dehydrogenase (non-decarboxylating)
MEFEITPQQKQERAAFRQFSVDEIAPHADRFDREEQIPPALIQKMALRGYLGGIIPKELGGSGLDMITYGLLNEELGRACSSVRSLLTVHDMVAQTILKWGSDYQKEKWLLSLARGKAIGAVALSEPNVGSDIGSIETTAQRFKDHYVLDGTKKWITFGQIADLFLVLARCDDKPTAFLVERDRPGVSLTALSGMLGMRASMLAEVRFDSCQIPSENLISRTGFGLLTVISTALSLGRYSVAWGCVGIAQACLEASLRYTAQRKQFGVLLREHQLIKRMVSEMVTNVKAARLLCYQVGYLKDTAHPHEVMETFVAKYFASRTAMKAATDAVQIHGAYGCSSEYPVQRFLRDAKTMEIIEGSNQIQQLTIADYGYQEFAADEEQLAATKLPESSDSQAEAE